MRRSHGHGDAASIQTAIERGDELNACKDTIGCSMQRWWMDTLVTPAFPGDASLSLSTCSLSIS